MKSWANFGMGSGVVSGDICRRFEASTFIVEWGVVDVSEKSAPWLTKLSPAFARHAQSDLGDARFYSKWAFDLGLQK